MRPFVALLSSLLLYGMIATAPGVIHAKPITLGGSLKSLNLYGERSPSGLAPAYWLSSNRARFEAIGQVDSTLSVNAAIDYQYLWSDPTGSFELSDNNINRYFDFDKTYTHSSVEKSRLQLDHLNIEWHQGPFDVTLGRQPVGFGRILIFSPLDVIAPFAPDVIDAEVRSGVDALRTVFHYGMDGQLGAIAVWGIENRYNSFLGTWTDNINGLDVLFIGGKLRGRSMLGAGLAGNLGPLGVKGEISVHRGRDRHLPNGDLYDSYAVGALEAWYRFGSGISLVAQYLHNGPGTDRPEEYLRVLNSAPIQEGLTHLLGRQYLIAAPAYEIHSLVTLQGLMLYNLRDESALVRPLLDINLSDNFSLQLFWTWNIGKSPSIKESIVPVTPRSEFGLRGDSGGAFLQYFF